MPKTKLRYKTIVLSDVHMGAPGCRIDEVGVICGHIHTPADRRIGGVHYLNSGDWVESLTALVEHTDGRWEVLPYATFVERLREQVARDQGAVPFRRRAAAGARSA